MGSIGQVKGPAKLAAWIERKALAKRRIARDLGISAPALLDWLDGTKTPSPHNRIAIERYTGGCVKADDWMTEAEKQDRRRVNSIQKFEPDEPAAE